MKLEAGRTDFHKQQIRGDLLRGRAIRIAEDRRGQDHAVGSASVAQQRVCSRGYFDDRDQLGKRSIASATVLSAAEANSSSDRSSRIHPDLRAQIPMRRASEQSCTIAVTWWS